MMEDLTSKCVSVLCFRPPVPHRLRLHPGPGPEALPSPDEVEQGDGGGHGLRGQCGVRAVQGVQELLLRRFPGTQKVPHSGHFS